MWQIDRRLFVRAAFVIAVGAPGGCAMGPGSGPSVAPSAAVVATIPVGRPPALLALAPDGRHVYAASNGLLTVIDATTNAVVASVKTDVNPTGIVVSPDGSRVYVADLFSNNLTTLDTSTNALTKPVYLFVQRFRGGFGWLALSPNGSSAYIANEINNTLVAVSLPSGQGDYVMPDVRPVDVALAPDGHTLYIAGCKPVCVPGFIELYDTATQRLGAEIEVGGSPYRVAVAPNGARAYTTNFEAPSVSVIDTAARRVVATVPVAVQPTGLAVSADSSTVWVASQTGSALTAIDAATNQVRARAGIPGARDVAVALDGRKVFVSGGGTVYVVDATRL